MRSTKAVRAAEMIFHARADAQRHQTQQRYTPEATTWVKIKNQRYSQTVGREDFFNRRRA
jgi:hypothetical protein